jgi:hypothetical protein
MKPDAFDDWLSNPVTEWVWQYLRDFQSAAGERMHAKWANGAVLTEMEQVDNRARIQTFNDLVTLTYDDIANFYRKDDAPEVHTPES